MDAETLAKQAAELEAQRQAAEAALEEAKAAAAAMETSRPPFWATEGQ